MTPTVAEREEIARVAKSVLAGNDGIEVPVELVEEEEDESPSKASDKGEEEEEGAKPLGLYGKIKALNVPQRVKLALRGNRESRSILLRDTNRMIPRMVLMNPRITEDEILLVTKDRNADVDVLRQIGENRDWAAHYGIRASLVENARTPVALALRLLKSLQDREIRLLAKSKNVSSAVSAEARRMLFRKQQTRTSH